MTKMRVHELAKELGIENKQLIDMLGKKSVEVKSHMSSLEDSIVNDIRKIKGGKTTASPAPEKTVTASPAPEKKVESAGADEETPKKKNIVQVFRPQNTKSGNRPQNNYQGQRPQQGGYAGQRPQSGQGGQGGQPSQRPAGQSNQRPIGQQSPTGQQNPTGQQSPRPAGQGYQNPTGQRPAGQGTGAPQRTGGQGQNTAPYRSNSQTSAPRQGGAGQGQRPYNSGQGGQRPAGTGQQRPYNGGAGQGQRTYGAGQGGQRPYNSGQGGQRTGAPRSGEGGQGYNNNRGPRPAGGGGNYQRPQGSFSGQGQRPGGNYQRPGNGPGRPMERRRDDSETAKTPIVDPQKVQRTKAKDKEKDFKKKEYNKNIMQDGKNKKGGKKVRTAAEVQKPVVKQPEKKVPEIKQIILPEILTIKELADKMKVVPSVIVKKLFLQGKIVTVNLEIDYDTAEEIAMEFDVLCEKEEVIDVIEELLKEDDEDESKMAKRSPVVCVMGHVDHGKTSLLDAIRNANVIGREAGGITQHIGAYVVETNGEPITFLDTPGHEAFTAMRMRGANATDIAILVVAADDGVMPQTVEAINHAKAAGIEIIVAINKIDKPSANIDRVKQELAEHELIPEDWGGSTIFVPVSAHTKEGITSLLEMVLLTAEVMELKANPEREARGLVIEGELDKGKGSVATVLVQKGTLRVGDAIAAGSAHGKVRAMMDDKGRRVKEAGPSQPVEILGLNGVPNAGEVFVGCETEKEARSFAETFISQNKVKLLEETKAKMSLDDLFTQIKEGNLKELNIVVKADVQGSVEALKQSLLKLSNDEVVIKIIHGGVGAINESDVILSSASNAIIIGFNVRPDATAKEIADREGVDLRLYRVIYSAIEDVEAAMKGMLDPIFEEKVLGHAEVRQTFKASGVGTIAGSYVLDGTFERNCSVRVTRDGVVIFDGPLASLKRFKDDVKEVRTGYECGFVFENFNDVKEGDIVEAFKMVEVERK